MDGTVDAFGHRSDTVFSLVANAKIVELYNPFTVHPAAKIRIST